MLIIIDKKIPEEAKNNLRKYGELVMLGITGVTERSISGHPDIFFCKTQNKLIIAPNLPEDYKIILLENNIPFFKGKSEVSAKYPEAAHYNAVITKTHLIHRTDITDKEILNDCINLSKIHVSQGFTRCSLLALNENNFITSDEGIYKIIISFGFHVLLVTTDNIILPGQRYGFIGGACGIHENKLFIIGNLKHHKDGEKIKQFAGSINYNIIELYNGPLFDGGSIIFIQQ
jgi:hypothetical protein